MKEERKTNIK